MRNHKNIYNPFIINERIAHNNFCDRVEETEQLIEALRNERNVVLRSRKKIGKTALIFHMFQVLARRNQYYNTMYVDLFPVQDLKSFAQATLKGLFRALDTDFNSKPKKVFDLVKAVGADLSFDADSGQLSARLHHFRKEEIRNSLKAIFNFLSQDRKPWVIAMDDIQQDIMSSRKELVNDLVSFIQESSKIRFILTTEVDSYFSDTLSKSEYRPLLSAQWLRLEPISIQAYTAFILRQFRSCGKQMTEEVPDHIYHSMKGQTFGIQLLCNRLFSRYDIIDHQIMDACMSDLIQEQQSHFYQIRQLITPFQWRLLSAIAFEGIVHQPLASDFIRRYELKAASSVQTALKALLEKALIIQENGYEVQDVLLAEWLRRMFG